MLRRESFEQLEKRWQVSSKLFPGTHSESQRKWAMSNQQIRARFATMAVGRRPDTIVLRGVLEPWFRSAPAPEPLPSRLTKTPDEPLLLEPPPLEPPPLEPDPSTAARLNDSASIAAGVEGGHGEAAVVDCKPASGQGGAEEANNQPTESSCANKSSSESGLGSDGKPRSSQPIKLVRRDSFGRALKDESSSDSDSRVHRRQREKNHRSRDRNRSRSSSRGRSQKWLGLDRPRPRSSRSRRRDRSKIDRQVSAGSPHRSSSPIANGRGAEDGKSEARKALDALLGPVGRLRRWVMLPQAGASSLGNSADQEGGAVAGVQRADLYIALDSFDHFMQAVRMFAGKTLRDSVTGLRALLEVDFDEDAVLSDEAVAKRSKRQEQALADQYTIPADSSRRRAELKRKREEREQLEAARDEDAKVEEKQREEQQQGDELFSIRLREEEAQRLTDEAEERLKAFLEARAAREHAEAELRAAQLQQEAARQARLVEQGLKPEPSAAVPATTATIKFGRRSALKFGFAKKRKTLSRVAVPGFELDGDDEPIVVEDSDDEVGEGDELQQSNSKEPVDDAAQSSEEVAASVANMVLQENHARLLEREQELKQALMQRRELIQRKLLQQGHHMDPPHGSPCKQHGREGRRRASSEVESSRAQSGSDSDRDRDREGEVEASSSEEGEEDEEDEEHEEEEEDDDEEVQVVLDPQEAIRLAKERALLAMGAQRSRARARSAAGAPAEAQALIVPPSVRLGQGTNPAPQPDALEAERTAKEQALRSLLLAKMRARAVAATE